MSSATYTTRSGDTWDTIALDVLGDERRAPDLMDANPAHVWTIRFGAGVELRVPDESTNSVAVTVPPWRTA